VTTDEQALMKPSYVERSAAIMAYHPHENISDGIKKLVECCTKCTDNKVQHTALLCDYVVKKP
jgi:hypothetical protein